MKGSIRRRGTTWEFNTDIGMAAAQRCKDCDRRFWIERKPNDAAPPAAASSSRPRSGAARSRVALRRRRSASRRSTRS